MILMLDAKPLLMGPTAKNLTALLAACSISFVSPFFRAGSALVARPRILLMSAPLSGIVTHLAGSEKENPYLVSLTRVPAAPAGNAQSATIAATAIKSITPRRRVSTVLIRSSSSLSLGNVAQLEILPANVTVVAIDELALGDVTRSRAAVGD